MTLLLDHKLVSRERICLVSVFPDIVKNCPKMRNLLEIFLTSFENVSLETETGTLGILSREGVQNTCTACDPEPAWSSLQPSHLLK